MLLPQYEFLGKGEPPKTLAGFKGMSVRALGGLGDAMEKLGARKNTVTATEVYLAIDRGTVNAVSFPFTYAHVAYKIDEVASWFTTNLSPGTVDCPTMVSLSAWNKLPKQYQDLMLEAKKPAYEALRAGRGCRRGAPKRSRLYRASSALLLTRRSCRARFGPGANYKFWLARVAVVMTRSSRP